MLPRWVTVAYLAYLVAPILLLLVGSFGGLWLNTLLPTGFTGRWYLEVAADPSFRRAFNSSLFVAAATGAACLAIGLPLAYAVFRAQSPALRAAARALYLLPIALPALVEYKNSVVYLDPRSTGVGQVLAFAANFAAGGDMTNVQPGLDYLGKLHKAGNVLRVLGTTPYAQFVKGEIPIWISYENDGLKAKYIDGLGDAVAVVIPKEASAAAPYGISLVEKGPNPNAGKLWLNFIMTEYGQGIFAQGFVRPSVPGVKLPDAVADKLPPAPQVRPLDVQAAAAKKADIDKGWVAATGAR
jgi:hypothetical protein